MLYPKAFGNIYFHHLVKIGFVCFFFFPWWTLYFYIYAIRLRHTPEYSLPRCFISFKKHCLGKPLLKLSFLSHFIDNLNTSLYLHTGFNPYMMRTIAFFQTPLTDFFLLHKFCQILFCVHKHTLFLIFLLNCQCLHWDKHSALIYLTLW